jgi:DNA-binding response OmpR family regulator
MSSVLLVENDEGIALAYLLRLRFLGHAVTTAFDAESAVALAKESRPDLVLMDISLAKTDGFVATRMIMHLYGGTAPPVIFITASSKPGLREQAMQLGAGFLQKPFDARQLVGAINAALGGALSPETRNWNDAA